VRAQTPEAGSVLTLMCVVEGLGNRWLGGVSGVETAPRLVFENVALEERPLPPLVHGDDGPRELGRMRAIVYERYGFEGVELRDVDEPLVDDDQVLVRVHASSVNPVEWYGVCGPPFVRVISGQLRRPKDHSLGVDLAGTVAVVGKGVTAFQPGDEVFGASAASWAQYAAAPISKLARKPANVSFEEAAAVPVAGLTALQALRDHGGLQPGQNVLINGASGGVGTFAVQIAKALGAEVTAVCSTHNVELARSLGADRVVDYTHQDFTRLGERHDLIVDIAGSRSFTKLRRVLRPHATVVVVGAKMGYSLLGSLKHFAGTFVQAIGHSQKAMFFMTNVETADLAYIGELIESGTVRSVIDRRYPLSDAVEALRYLGQGHAQGKIILNI
jgi:NADPH:quinone reductase-like Zn-dependent oxidoreductase